MGSPSPETDTRAEARGGVTRRAVLLALVLLLLLGFLDFYIDMVWGQSWAGGWGFSSGAPSVVPISVLFLLTLLMALPWLRRRGLRRRELLVIYSMLLVGVPTVSHAVLAWMLVRVIAFHYGAQVHRHWTTHFLGYVPTWWSPTSLTAAEGFFQGRAQVPWGEWLVPLAAWSSFAFGIFLATFCLMSLVQRQWITHERLTFPLAQVPLEMVREPEGGPRRAAWLPLGSVFGLGVLIAFSLNFLSSLSTTIPALPSLSLFLYDIIPWQRVGPLAGLGGLTVVLWPWMIALSYLIPADLSFSLWVFTLLRLALTVLAIAAGATPQRPEDWYDSSFPAPVFQGTGAVLALAVWVLWVARKHLGRSLRIALSRQSGRADADEPLTYRFAFVGLIVATGYLVYFLSISGLRPWVGALLILLTIGYFMVWARLRAENGMAFICYPTDLDHMLAVQFGNSSFRPVESVAMITLRWVWRPGFSVSSEIFAGSVLETFKIADAARIDARPFAKVLLLGFAFAWITGAVIVLTGIYRYGWFGLSCAHGGWLGPMSIGDGNTIVTRLLPTDPDYRAMVGVAAGALVTIGLGLLRLRFWWWPLHPVGYLAANTWGSHWWCIPFFIGWVGKVLVTRYGGLRLYRRTIPLAAGLIVGDLLNGMVWSFFQVLSGGAL